MKNKSLLLIIFFLTFLLNHAQNEAAVWYFGNNAGVDFNTGSPVVLTDGQLNTNEGCSTISNSNGDLLFYTDGITVWDKNHNIMPNGTGLLGDPSSTQSGIIVPKPNNPDIYYIFTVAQLANSDGFRYSEVDLTLNLGNGDVNTNKNILLTTPTTEKISAIEHANGNDIWVITHDWNNNNFLAYLVTSTGINTTPIISSVGSDHTGDIDNTIGYLKFSPSGEKLAIANTFTPNFVEIFDFDTATGIVTNPILLDNNFHINDAGPYGIEFSPNSELLYVTDVNFDNNTTKIHQFNITLTDAVAISNSVTILYDGIQNLGALQLAIDGKIYVSIGFSPFLGVIENPDTLGIGANYIHNSLDLNGNNATFGLPPFIQSFFSAGIVFENNCLGTTNDFSVNTNSTIDSILWNFGDGNTSTLENPLHDFATAGQYDVTVTITSGADSITLNRTLVVSEVPIANAMQDYILCDDSSNDEIETFNLTTKDAEILNTQSSTQFNVSYYASQEDAENNVNALASNYSNTVNNQELFAKIYNIDNNNCFAITSFNLIVSEFPIANMVADVILCDDVAQDGVEPINLTSFNNDVLGSQNASNFNVSYHLTQANANSNVAALPEIFIASSQTIFVRIQNAINTNCFNTTSFNIVIDDYFAANQPDNMFLCDDANNHGVEFFDLMSQNTQILAGLTGNYNVSYHTSLNDADNNINAIVGTYENTSNAEEIFVRIEKTTNIFCYQTLSFFIEVKQTPINTMETEWVICTNETLVLTADAGFDGYLWSTGETTSFIEVASSGSYTVTVTNNYSTIPTISCSSTKTVTVTESDEAVFNNVSIVDWTVSDNEISVFVDGIGDYEYSIDGTNYQDSNLFSGLEPGDYTVFVKDKLGCGVIQEAVYLLFYPYFFTPNNDNYNDFWQIKFSETEPNLEIFIFDRFGKLLTTLNPRSSGWDGTFKGQLMPASDYWFIVKRPNTGKEYKGHFTLKR